MTLQPHITTKAIITYRIILCTPYTMYNSGTYKSNIINAMTLFKKKAKLNTKCG